MAQETKVTAVNVCFFDKVIENLLLSSYFLKFSVKSEEVNSKKLKDNSFVFLLTIFNLLIR